MIISLYQCVSTRLQRAVSKVFSQIFTGFIIAALGGVPALAQSLNEALVTTFETNSGLRMAQIEASQSVENYNQVVAQTKLQVVGTLGLARQNSNSETNGGAFIKANTTTGQLAFKQSLLQGSLEGIPAGIRQALGLVNVAHAGYKASESAVLVETVGAYMDLLGDQETLGVAISGVAIAERELEAALARRESGRGTRTDVALAEAGRAQAQANLGLAQAEVQVSRALFEQAVGRAPEDLFDPGIPLLPASLEVAVARALRDNPLFKAAEINLALAEDAVLTTQAQYGMGIEALASASQSRVDAGSPFTSETYSFGIQASIPLSTGGQRLSAIRAAEQGIALAQANLNSQRTAVEAQVTAAWASAQAQFSSLNALNAVAQARALVLQATRAEFDAGTSTFLAVQTAQQKYEESQNQYLRAKSDAVVAAYTLISAMGGMTSERLGLAVSHFDTFDVLDQNRNLTYGEMLFGIAD